METGSLLFHQESISRVSSLGESMLQEAVALSLCDAAQEAQQGGEQELAADAGMQQQQQQPQQQPPQQLHQQQQLDRHGYETVELVASHSPRRRLEQPLPALRTVGGRGHMDGLPQLHSPSTVADTTGGPTASLSSLSILQCAESFSLLPPAVAFALFFDDLWQFCWLLLWYVCCWQYIHPPYLHPVAGALRGSECDCSSPHGSSAHTPDGASIIIDYSGGSHGKALITLAPSLHAGVGSASALSRYSRLPGHVAACPCWVWLNSGLASALLSPSPQIHSASQ